MEYSFDSRSDIDRPPAPSQPFNHFMIMQNKPALIEFPGRLGAAERSVHPPCNSVNSHISSS